MSKEPIYTLSGPVHGAPYTPGVKVGDLVFISGQIPLDPHTGVLVEGGFDAQVRQSISNLQAILDQEGMTLDDIVKTTVFLADLDNFAELNRVYGGYFTSIRPARSCVQVARLPLDSLVEIEAIALKK
ncbi:MAG: RidA family protein [Capsulimonadaceae bacterium]|nr:RidA family protein [Capsulimonadaceae bacterium]